MQKTITTFQLIEQDSLYMFLIAAFLGIALAFSVHHQPQKQIISIPVMQTFQNPIVSLEPSPHEVVNQVSPDGSMKLTMTEITNADLSHTYTFRIGNEASQTQRTLYTVTVPSTDSMTIPFNSWSPDNTYLFLEHHTKDGVHVLVFRSDGEDIMDGQKYLNGTDIYNARQTGYAYDETTGWASDTLLIVNSKQSDGNKGPSFWVEIPSQAVIQLATEF